MSLIIDGYNLLHAAGILGAGIGPGSLEHSRLALLNFLAESLLPEEIPQTTVVFDSKDAPWGAPGILEHRGIAVQFASRWPDADCLIEELIARDSAPRRLTVVSSDHRLRRAARRRRAKAVQSDLWYNELVQRRLARRQSESAVPERPPTPLLAEDVEYWVRQFGGESELERWMRQELAAERPGNRLDDSGRTCADMNAEKAILPFNARQSDPRTCVENYLKDDQPLDSVNPFPPGYAEDLEEKEE
jgi:predicted RNA-binding protein with PIN domain